VVSLSFATHMARPALRLSHFNPACLQLKPHTRYASCLFPLGEHDVFCTHAVVIQHPAPASSHVLHTRLCPSTRTMRLLHTEDGMTFSLVEFLADIPPYAILSHTWSADEDEVTFKDVIKRKNLHKLGYAKLKFCAKQAARDGFDFFWIYTCCIDKSSSVELSEAINSMFKWYRDAKQCNVLLSDVPNETCGDSFEESRWFKRGWTLQELLAPNVLLFFLCRGCLHRYQDDTLVPDLLRHQDPDLGFAGRATLHLQPQGALLWAAKRQTKRQEDAAYSLMDLFNVHMPLIYGERRGKAFARLKNEVAVSREAASRDDWLHTLVRGENS
jgi:hypothetical protein